VSFTGTSAGGWSGSTTINAGMTLALGTTSDANSRALANTSGITMNGGGLTLNFGGTIASNRVNDSAAIGVNGGGTITIGTASSSITEDFGALTLNSGQLNLQYVSNPSSGGFMTFSSFTRAGSASALTVSGNFTGGSNFVVSGATATPTNEIIGAWATTGGQGGIAAQTDYAVFNSSGQFRSSGIAASAESSWASTHSATSNFTMSAIDSATISGGGRNVNTLRSLNNSVAFTANNANITLNGHTLAVGDLVTFSAGSIPTGLTAGTPYYVVSTGTNTIQVSATKGGAAIAPTTGGSTVVAAGGIQVSSGNNLGTFGMLNGSATTLNILRDGAGGSITLPTTAAGNLYVTAGAGAITIAAPIENNTGALTLVKSGNSTLTLTGTNTYTGGTVINAGTLSFNNAVALGADGSRNITFGGTGSLTWGFDSASLGSLTVDAGAVGTLTSANTITFATTSGSGTIRAVGGQNKTQNLGDASNFTGNVALAYNANNNSGANSPHITFSSLNDAVGSSLQFYRQGSGTDSGQVGQIALTGNTGSLTFDNRQVQLLPRTGGSGQSMTANYLLNNNSTAANKWVINTDLLNLYDRNPTLGLGGTNAGDNAFNGVIGNSTFTGPYGSGTGVLSVNKTEGGKWILGNTANTYTGTTTISAGILEVKSLADGGSASSIGAASSNLIFGTGTRLRYTGDGDSTNRSFTINGTSAGHNAVIEASGTGVNSGINFTSMATPGYGTIDQTRTLTLTGTNTDANTLAAALTNNGTGALSVSKLSPGRWVLTGANSYTGTTTISAGVLQAIEGSSIATNTGISLDGGVFQSSGTFTRSVGAVNTAGSTTYNMTANGGGFSAIGGKFTVTLDNTANVRNWGTTVSTSPLVGTLKFGSASSNAEVEMTNNINLNGTNRTIEVTAGVGGDFATMSGVLSNSTGTAGFTKTGTGRLVLTNTNTYNGATNINGGILQIALGGSTSASSAVTVSNSGSGLIVDGTVNGTLVANASTTVSGSGTISGAATISGNLNPGSSPGLLSFGSSLTMADTTVTTMEIDGNVRGTSYDAINAVGTLAYNGVFTLDLGLILAKGTYTYDLFDFGSQTGEFDSIALTGNYTGSFTNNMGVWTATTNGGEGTWTFTQSTGVFGVTVIPEPSTMLLGALGVLALLRRRR
jgi:fibronectin-binding autotransporter adhesin